jgi:hypothetical protein
MKGGMKDLTILEQILVLKEMPLLKLRKKYSEVFDCRPAPSKNKTYLWQRIAYRIQELAYGSLSEEAHAKVKELAQEYDPINNKALRPDVVIKRHVSRDKRLPIPGTVNTEQGKRPSPILSKEAFSRVEGRLLGIC